MKLNRTSEQEQNYIGNISQFWTEQNRSAQVCEEENKNQGEGEGEKKRRLESGREREGGR